MSVNYIDDITQNEVIAVRVWVGENQGAIEFRCKDFDEQKEILQQVSKQIQSALGIYRTVTTLRPIETKKSGKENENRTDSA